MILTPELVAATKEAITNPSKYKLPNRPLTECFTESETVTANHILAKDFIENEYPNLSKVLLYIIMEELYGPARVKDAHGDLGYNLTYKQAHP
jgi:hypothetical protein